MKHAVIDRVRNSHYPRADQDRNECNHRQCEEFGDRNQRASRKEPQSAHWQRERKTGCPVRRTPRQSANAEQRRQEYPDLLEEIRIDEVIDEERVVAHCPQEPCGIVVLGMLYQIPLPIVLDPGVGKGEEGADGDCDDRGNEEACARFQPRFVPKRTRHDWSRFRLSSTISLRVIGKTSTEVADCALILSAIVTELCEAITETVRPSTATRFTPSSTRAAGVGALS